MPFRLLVADGRSYDVRHPERLASVRNGRMISVATDEGFVILDAPKPHDTAKTIRFGLIVLGCSIALGLTPLVVGKSGLTKYFLAFAFVGGCLGLLCLLLGAIERVQQRKRLPPLPPGEGTR